MKDKDLLHAMNEIDSGYVQEAMEQGAGEAGKKRRRMAAWLTAAACVCIAAGVGVWVARSGKGSVDDAGGGNLPTLGANGTGSFPAGGENVAGANPGEAASGDESGNQGGATSGNVSGELEGTNDGISPGQGNGTDGNAPGQPIGAVSGDSQDSLYAEFAIAQAQYPECVQYPSGGFFDSTTEEEWENYKILAAKWREERDGRIQASEGHREALYPFYEETMQELLVSDENVNRTYSPMNLYMALCMLAELTDGNSRAQILDLLDAPDIGTVRERAEALWTANYSDDGMVTSILANSVWLRAGDDFIEETMRILREVYHASAFEGEMGSEEFTQALRTWINAQTGGLLTEQTEKIETTARTVLELVSTVYYRAQWQERFWEGNTKEGIFHAAGGDVTCDFMHQGKVDTYYRGKDFAAVCLGLEKSGDMWLFLPDEGADVNAVIKGGEILELIRGAGTWENKRYTKINLAMPKFDIASDTDLVGGLKAMGVTDVFDVGVADFSPVREDADEIFLNEAKHAVRVCVDEKGCTAAAYTQLELNDGAAMAMDEVDFVLDRPFLFAVTGADGTVLFVGVVEEP